MVLNIRLNSRGSVSVPSSLGIGREDLVRVPQPVIVRYET
jgi:hypothetical protein